MSVHVCVLVCKGACVSVRVCALVCERACVDVRGGRSVRVCLGEVCVCECVCVVSRLLVKYIVAQNQI